MPKTYNTFTNVSTGDVLTATNFNNVLTNIGNYRVPPAAQVQRAAGSNQSISSFPTYLAWNNTTAVYDTDGMWSSGDNTKLVTKTAGIYIATAALRFDFGGSATIPNVYLTWTTSAGVESDVADYYHRLNSGSLTGTLMITIAGTYSCAADGYFRVKVPGFDGGTGVSLVAGDSTRFSATWLGQVS